VSFVIRYEMSGTPVSERQALFLRRAAEFRELSRTATDPVLRTAYGQIAKNYEELAKAIAEEER
jgi:hypothetical protein